MAEDVVTSEPFSVGKQGILQGFCGELRDQIARNCSNGAVLQQIMVRIICIGTGNYQGMKSIEAGNFSSSPRDSGTAK
jgi:hypothetical protein